MPRSSRVARSRAFATPSSGRTICTATGPGARTRLDPRRHGGEAVEAAAAGEPHQQGLGLIVAGVRVQAAWRYRARPCNRTSADSAPRGRRPGGPSAAWPPATPVWRGETRALAARSATAGASAADSGRRRWSTVSTVWTARCRHPSCRSQSANSTMSAVLSLPPDTASAHARSVRSAKGPNRPSSSSGRIGWLSPGIALTINVRGPRTTLAKTRSAAPARPSTLRSPRTDAKVWITTESCMRFRWISILFPLRWLYVRASACKRRRARRWDRTRN